MLMRLLLIHISIARTGVGLMSTVDDKESVRLTDYLSKTAPS